MREKLPPELLDPRFWEKHSNRFLAFALSCMSRRPFRGAYGKGSGAEEARDYVTDALMRILDGSRRCPAHVSPVVFVLGVIRSLVSHSGDKRENRSPHAFIDDVSAKLNESSMVGGRESADAVFEANELAQRFLEAAPAKYRAYIEVLMSGLYATAEERAQVMGVSVERIRQLDKAVRRLRSQWGMQMRKSPPRA